MPNRSSLNVVISQAAHDGWRDFAAIHGATVSALVEAIGLSLSQLDDPEAELPPLLRKTVLRARQIAADRSSRRRGDETAEP